MKKLSGTKKAVVDVAVAVVDVAVAVVVVAAVALLKTSSVPQTLYERPGSTPRRTGRSPRTRRLHLNFHPVVLWSKHHFFKVSFKLWLKKAHLSGYFEIVFKRNVFIKIK